MNLKREIEENMNSITEVSELFLRHKQIYLETVSVQYRRDDGFADVYATSVSILSDEFDTIAARGIIGARTVIETVYHDTISELNAFYLSKMHTEEVTA